MDGAGEERDTFPRRPSVSLQVKQHSIQSCFADVAVTLWSKVWSVWSGLYKINKTARKNNNLEHYSDFYFCRKHFKKVK